MKKRTLVLSLLLTLALVFGSFSSVFAAEKTGPATEGTKVAIEKSGIQTTKKFTNEVGAESYSIKFVKEVLKGKYKVIGTSGVKKAVKKGNAGNIEETISTNIITIKSIDKGDLKNNSLNENSMNNDDKTEKRQLSYGERRKLFRKRFLEMRRKEDNTS